ncbi:MAG TPA: YbaB/EbfC family nucleoid-associated protein [Bdellovibrionales bacterium]|nr:YbaB/EbfC family nucleoid-associated protein [Bdellovibrionales bacterium]
MKGMQGGMQQFIKQANQLQAKIKKLQEELATREYEGTAGGGAVTVKVNGDNKLVSLSIKEEVMKAGDVEMLQDLVLTATNEALRIAKETSETEMNKLTGGFGLPGML